MARPRPKLVFADANGDIYDHPDLYMLVRRGEELALPRPDELIPLPEESELFLLPGRHAIGFDEESGETELLEEQAVAAFAAPAHTLSGTAAFVTGHGAPTLPMFAYGAVGYANDRFYLAAKRVDQDNRQVFTDVPKKRIQKGAQDWLKAFPENRLVSHLMGCALTNCCPAARNLCLGRYEAPLPTSQVCNARCVGCISLQPEDSGFPATQGRITFTPTAREIVQIMERHGGRETEAPVFSFGQGCEGEPLTEGPLLAEATRLFRDAGGRGTVNVNTNASLTREVERFAESGGSSIRVSLNSARQALYTAYYRPKGYGFSDVHASIKNAKEGGLFVSLNYLFFPGVSDTEEEFAALLELVETTGVDFIQLRNLNLDPEIYLNLAKPTFPGAMLGPAMGLLNFRKRLKKEAPWLGFGYFNPYLPES